MNSESDASTVGNQSPSQKVDAVRVGSRELVRCRCGSTHFYRNYRANGWWGQLIDTSGGNVKIVDTFLDNLKYGREPKTMRCGDCGRRAPNPSASNNKLSEPAP